jgi:hypothetical protein
MGQRMSDLIDKLHDLAHHAYDTVTGSLHDPAAKYQTPAGQPDVGTGIAAAGQDTLAERSGKLNDAIDSMTK